MDRDRALQELVARYRRARLVWAENKHIRAAARVLGMEEREYCDRFIQHNFGPLTWAGTSTSPHATLMKPDFDDAFDEAAP